MLMCGGMCMSVFGCVRLCHLYVGVWSSVLGCERGVLGKRCDSAVVPAHLHECVRMRYRV